MPNVKRQILEMLGSLNICRRKNRTIVSFDKVSLTIVFFGRNYKGRKRIETKLGLQFDPLSCYNSVNTGSNDPVQEMYRRIDFFLQICLFRISKNQYFWRCKMTTFWKFWPKSKTSPTISPIYRAKS